MPLYAAGFVTAFGAHSIAAGLAGLTETEHASLLTLGLLLAIYDSAEVPLKPVFRALADRIGPRPVLLGGLVVFAVASTTFVLAGNPGLVGIARHGLGPLATGAVVSLLAAAAGLVQPAPDALATRGACVIAPEWRPDCWRRRSGSRWRPSCPG